MDAFLCKAGTALCRHRLRGGRSIRGMRPHDAVIVNRAHNSAFASIMSAPMVVNLNTRGEGQALNQTIAVEHHIEIHPHMAVCGPGPSGGNHSTALSANMNLLRLSCADRSQGFDLAPIPSPLRFGSSNSSVWRMRSLGVSSRYFPPKEWLCPVVKLVNDIL